MQPFNKDILKEFVNNELLKGLKIKYIYDYEPKIATSVNHKRICLEKTSNSQAKGDLHKGSFSQVRDKTNPDLKAQKDHKKCKTCLREPDESFQNTNSSPKSRNFTTCVIHPICKTPRNIRIKKRNPESRIIKREQSNLQKTAKIRRSDIDRVFVLVKNRSYRNTRQSMRINSTSEKYRMKTKTTAVAETQRHCNFRLKQKNIFDRSRPSKYRNTIQQMLELPNGPQKKDHVIGPIPIQAEGIHDLTSRIEQLVLNSSNGVVQRKLKLCKENEDSDTCFEFDVFIRKISIEEITVRSKQQARSILSPFFCFSARSDSEDCLNSYTKCALKNPKCKVTSDAVKNKAPWRLNIPFLHRFRSNPHCCNVKVLKCGLTPSAEGKGKSLVSLKNERGDQISSPVVICHDDSSSIYSSGKIKFASKESSKAFNRGRYTLNSCMKSRRGKGSKKVLRFLEDTDVRYSLNFSLPLRYQSQVTMSNSRGTTFNSHCAPLLKTHSPVMSQQIYLTPIDCATLKLTPGLSNKQTSQLLKKEKVKNLQENRTRNLKQDKNRSQLLRSSFRNAFGDHLQACFKRVFETRNIDFINPYDLESSIKKNFIKPNICLKRGSFKKSSFCRCFCTFIHKAKMPGFHKILLSPCFFSSVNISVEVDHLAELAVCKTLKPGKDEWTINCERELKSTFHMKSQVESKTIAKRKKNFEPHKHINNFTVNMHPSNFKRLGTVIPKWTRGKLKSQFTSKGAAGDEIGDKNSSKIPITVRKDIVASESSDQLNAVRILSKDTVATKLPQKKAVQPVIASAKVTSEKTKSEYVTKGLETSAKTKSMDAAKGLESSGKMKLVDVAKELDTSGNTKSVDAAKGLETSGKTKSVDVAKGMENRRKEILKKLDNNKANSKKMNVQNVHSKETGTEKHLVPRERK